MGVNAGQLVHADVQAGVHIVSDSLPLATRHSLGPLKRQQLHHRPTLHLDNFGHLNHVYLPRVYNRRMEYPEDSMSYEARGTHGR